VTALTMMVVLLIPTTQEEVLPIYESNAKILLTPTSSGTAKQSGNAAVPADVSSTWFADETLLRELILSEDLLSRVAAQAENNTDWLKLREQVRVKPLSGDRSGIKLFELAVSSLDPKESQKLTRLVADQFTAYVQELSAREFANTRRFVEELVLEAEQRRIQAEEALMEVREKYLGLPTDQEIASRQQSLEAERHALQREVGALQAEITSIRTYLNGSRTSPPWSVLQSATGAIGNVESDVAKQKLELHKLKQIYTDQSDVVRTAEQRLKNAEGLYQQALDEYVDSLYTEKSTQLQQALQSSQSISAQLNDLLRSRMSQDDRRIVAKLERERSLWEENHLSLIHQLYQARVVEQASRRQGAVNLLEQPRLGMPINLDALNTSAVTTLALALPFCLVMGVGAAFLRDHLASSLRLRPRVEEMLEVPVIAVIPSSQSELTVDWERFKRPLPMAIEQLTTTHTNGRSLNGSGRVTSNSDK